MAGKIILFIVEGASDETALGSYLTEKFKEKKFTLTIRIMGGDITTAWVEEYTKNTFEVTPRNINVKLTELITKYLKSSEASLLGIKPKDIGKVYYVTDTDNCFNLTASEKINKAKCMETMFTFREIKINKQKIVPLEVIFFGENLEHITQGRLENFSDKEKEEFAEEFAFRSLTEPNFFENIFRSKDIKQWNDYTESYKAIKTYSGRSCNMNNLLDEIENEIIL
ncbi:hypothetical protein [Cetobacterium sp. SF1]|uniref:hypothetical protein n=1 Tax=Cetobacterium sp. SF1 TaxID=3417654 RepID=UPI003CF9F77F